MTYIFSLQQSEWIRWLNCTPFASPPLFVLVNNCVSSRKDFNLKLFYFSMCGVAHGFSWFLLGVTGFLQVSLWDIVMPILNMEEEKSISVYVCLTLWQVVDLWTAGSVSGIIYGLYGQSRGWEWVLGHVTAEISWSPCRRTAGTNQSVWGRGRGGLSNRFILKLPEAQVNLPHRTAPCALEPAAWEQLSRPEGTGKGELMTEMYKVSLEEPVHTSAQALSLSQHEWNAAWSALCFCFLVYLPPRLHFTSLASRRSCLSLPTERVGTGLRGNTISTSILVCQTLLLTFLFAW